MKYRIDLTTETKWLTLPGGGEVSAEATDCEILFWKRILQLESELDGVYETKAANPNIFDVRFKLSTEL